MLMGKQIWFLVVLWGARGEAGQGNFPSVAQEYRSYKEAQLPAECLSSIIIAVNGQPRLVASGGTLDFMRGDKLEIQEASLSNRKKDIAMVSIVGYQPVNTPYFKDLRGYTIDTASELLEANEQKSGEAKRYMIMASTKNLIHGKVFLEAREPKLAYVEVRVNGEPRVVRPGERLVVKGDDLFKVTRVATSIHDPRAVGFAVAFLGDGALEKQNLPAAASSHAIVVSNGAYEFGSIPLYIEK